MKSIKPTLAHVHEAIVWLLSMEEPIAFVDPIEMNAAFHPKRPLVYINRHQSIMAWYWRIRVSQKTRTPVTLPNTYLIGFTRNFLRDCFN